MSIANKWSQSLEKKLRWDVSMLLWLSKRCILFSFLFFVKRRARNYSSRYSFNDRKNFRMSYLRLDSHWSETSSRTSSLLIQRILLSRFHCRETRIDRTCCANIVLASRLLQSLWDFDLTSFTNITTSKDQIVLTRFEERDRCDALIERKALMRKRTSLHLLS